MEMRRAGCPIIVNLPRLMGCTPLAGVVCFNEVIMFKRLWMAIVMYFEARELRRMTKKYDDARHRLFDE